MFIWDWFTGILGYLGKSRHPTLPFPKNFFGDHIPGKHTNTTIVERQKIQCSRPTTSWLKICVFWQFFLWGEEDVVNKKNAHLTSK